MTKKWQASEYPFFGMGQEGISSHLVSYQHFLLHYILNFIDDILHQHFTFE